LKNPFLWAGSEIFGSAFIMGFVANSTIDFLKVSGASMGISVAGLCRRNNFTNAFAQPPFRGHKAKPRPLGVDSTVFYFSLIFKWPSGPLNGVHF